MFIELLRKRRSIRQFKDKPVSAEHCDLLIEAALRSPSSRGFNPWQFVVVKDKALLAQLSRAKTHGAAFLKNAPLALVVCADTSKTDVWIEDASIAAVIIHLAAADLGLGSCWAQMRLRSRDDGTKASDYISSLLDLPGHVQVEAVIGIGHPAEELDGHDSSTLLYDQVSYEKFGQKS
ncbi:nitroreductase family protein [uncultured Desulfobacter sp.]|uniref:nitroreductase family protein n=1 Tax=uncultured Desulfobacter sp. TaxID=240139 RepID=UPI002AAAC4FD|nr:nitroreductase family protein [uncultured Desulfobacter sp.]